VEESKKEKEQMKDDIAAQQALVPSSDSDEEEIEGRTVFVDPWHDQYHSVSQPTLPIQTIPLAMQAAAKKIFSKHSRTDIREWSKQLMA